MSTCKWEDNIEMNLNPLTPNDPYRGLPAPLISKRCILCIYPTNIGTEFFKHGISDHVRNEEVLFRVNEQRNILHEIIKRKANWIGHSLRRNCLLKQVIEGKIK